MQYTNVVYCQLWTTQKANVKACDLPAGSVLLLIESGEMFTKVVFQSTREIVGWIDNDYLEEITYALPHDVVVLDHQTNSLQDLNQYVYVNGVVQYNLCGEICTCYILGVPLSLMFQQWKAIPLSWYNRIFQGGKAATTGIPDLINMLSAFPDWEYKNITHFFTVGNRLVVTPARLKSVLADGWKIIISVHINSAGKVKGAGILHWVTITDIVPNGINDGWIDFYNPASNNVERMDWKNFSASMGVPFGLAVRLKE